MVLNVIFVYNDATTSRLKTKFCLSGFTRLLIFDIILYLINNYTLRH